MSFLHKAMNTVPLFITQPGFFFSLGLFEVGKEKENYKVNDFGLITNSSLNIVQT